MAKRKKQTFIDFCEDTLRLTLTDGQWALLTVAIDNVDPCDIEDPALRDIARTIFGDVDRIPDETRGWLVAVCGRRAGKSYFLASLYQLWRLLTADIPTLAPGEPAYAFVVAADKETAKCDRDYVQGAIDSVPSIADMVVEDSQWRVMLKRPDGKLVAYEVRAASRRGSATRGRTLVSAAIDECAFLRDEASGAAINANEIADALDPGLIPGGLLVLCSTPYSEEGLLYDEFVRNWGHPKTAVAAHSPTLLLNPSQETKVDRARQRDPDNARREFDAVFMSKGASAFFDAGATRAQTRDDVPIVTEAPRRVRVTVGVGGDLGLVRDAAAIVAVHKVEAIGDQPAKLYVADALEIRPDGNPLKLSRVVKAFAEFAAKHGMSGALVDHYALEPAREHAEPLGFEFYAVEGGQPAKVARHISARDLINDGTLAIPGALKRLTDQLIAVTAKPTPGGGLQIGSPRRDGVHGDLASAFVLSVKALEDGQSANLSLFASEDGGADCWGNARQSTGSRWDKSDGQGFG